MLWRHFGEEIHSGMFGVVLYVGMTPWWRHQLETFSALLALCAGNSPVLGEFPSQRPVTRSFDVFFDLSLIKRLSKQSRGWWFETPPRPLWRRFPFSLGSIYVGHSSVLIRKCIGRLIASRCYIGLDSVLDRPWIGVRSAGICPIHKRTRTDKPFTIGGRIKTDTSPNAPRQNRQNTDILPTDNRQFVGERSFKHVCLPEHKPTPNRQIQINTDGKPISPRNDDCC